MTSRWIKLLVMTRLLAAGVALLLLVVHRVTGHDLILAIAVIAYTAVSLLALSSVTRLQLAPAAWLVDGLVVLALIASSEDWRSPFYVLMITALILPSIALPLRSALAWGATFTLAYLGVALYTELDANTLTSTIRLETIATHLMVPLLVVLALAYAAEVLERLRAERIRAERLAVESERQRIAWDLHDSAKQRVHSAHLVVSALQGQVHGGQAALVGNALAELRAAGADMDTSVAELRAPLEGRSLERMLVERATELGRTCDALIRVRGSVDELPEHVVAHAYRIGAEALANAVRHGGAEHITVTLARDQDGATIEVVDDGCGLPEVRRAGANGMDSMRARAETIGAVLTIGPPDGARGTRVQLLVPAAPPRQGHAR